MTAKSRKCQKSKRRSWLNLNLNLAAGLGLPEQTEAAQKGEQPRYGGCSVGQEKLELSWLKWPGSGESRVASELRARSGGEADGIRKWKEVGRE